MRRWWIGAAVLVLAAGCAASPATGPATPATAGTGQLNPARIKRIGAEFPPGYEVAGVAGPSSPARVWGLGADATSSPALCAALADPLGADAPVQGVSGSGPGGIVYAVVVTSSTGSVALDPARAAGCGQWSMRDGHARAGVRQIEAPDIDGAQTFGMTTDVATVVEGGGEIGSQANTFIAYLGDCYAFTALITDPGSPQAHLEPGFAADLLVKTVSALRT